MFFTKKMKVETVTKQLKDDYIHFFEKFIMEFEIFGINVDLGTEARDSIAYFIYSSFIMNLKKSGL